MKGDRVYFDCLAEMASIALEMAHQLNSFLLHFHPSALDVAMNRLHELERQGDAKRHALMKAVAKAFVTPVNRSDLIHLGQKLDDVLDAIEAVAMQLHIGRVRQLRPDALRFSELVIRCADAVARLTEEFRHFQTSNRISEWVIRVNQLEEEGDRLYLSAVRSLHTTSMDPVELLVWQAVYGAFENVCNRCEEVADAVEGIAIDNL